MQTEFIHTHLYLHFTNSVQSLDRTHFILYHNKITMKRYNFEWNFYSILKQTFNFSWFILASLICAASYYDFLVIFHVFYLFLCSNSVFIHYEFLQQNGVFIPAWEFGVTPISPTWIYFNIVTGTKFNEHHSIETTVEQIQNSSFSK